MWGKNVKKNAESAKFLIMFSVTNQSDTIFKDHSFGMKSEA